MLRRNLLLYIVLLIAIFMGGLVTVKRYLIESGNINVEIAVLIDEFEKLGAKEGYQKLKTQRNVSFEESYDYRNLLELLRRHGVTTVALREDTLNSLAERGIISVMKGSEILNLIRVGARMNPMLYRHLSEYPVVAEHYYVMTDSKSIYERLSRELTVRMSDENAAPVQERVVDFSWGGEFWGQYEIEICSSDERILELGLGFDEKKVEEIGTFGFELLFLVRNHDGISEAQIKRYFETFRKLKKPGTIAFEGKEALGYPSRLNATVEMLRNSGKIRLGDIEFEEPAGESTIVRALSGILLRINRVTEAESGKYGPGELEKLRDRYLRAIRERNVRLVIPMILDERMLAGTGDLIKANLEYLRNLADALKKEGYHLSEAHPVEAELITPVMLLVISWGVFALLIIVVDNFFLFARGSRQIALLIFTLVTLLVLLNFASDTVIKYYRLSMASLAAMLVPVYPFIRRVKQVRKMDYYHIFERTLSIFLLYFLFTFLGTLLISGLLSDEAFISGAEGFRGVKLALIFPVITMVAIAIVRGKAWQYADELLEIPIKLKHILFLFVAGITGYVLIVRSGNIFDFSVVFPGFEEDIRYSLEKFFLIRPRTKEFLIGYPALFFYIYASLLGHRRLASFISVFAVIAPISFVNTFCHIHTPVAVSMVRAINGALIGLVVSLFVTAGYQYIYNVITARQGNKG